MKHLSIFLLLVAFPGGIEATQYIIEMTDVPKQARSARRAQALRELEQRRAHVQEATSATLDTLIVDVDDRDLYAIATLPSTKRIYRSLEYRPASATVDAAQSVTQAWEKIGGWEKAGEGVRIAILDTGIDSTHPAFQMRAASAPEGFPRADRAANLRWTNAKVIVARSYENLNRQYGAAFGTEARDVHGHGTASAMIAAGVPHESPQGTLAGVAPRAYVGNYKVLGDASAGSTAGVLKAIDDAVSDGMQVLNLSLGSGLAARPEDDVIVQALERAIAQGVVVVVAAGNTGTGLNSISSPGTAPNAITVGSHSAATGLVTWFSGKGPNNGAGLKPDLLAVGDNFFTADSTLRPGSTGYRTLAGTSLSTPVVAGMTAVVAALRPGLSPAEYRSLIINAAAPITGRALETGAGRADLARSIDATVTATPSYLRADSASVSLSGSAAGCLAEVEGTGLEAWVSGTHLEARFAARAEGWVTVRCVGAPPVRIPFWHSAGETAAAEGITLLDAPRSAVRNSIVEFGVRLVDVSGTAMPGLPQVTVASGNAQVQGVTPMRDVAGAIAVRVRIGSGDNVIRLSAGPVEREVRIQGQ